VIALRLLLRRFVRRGRLGVIDHTGRRFDFGVAGTGPSAAIRLHDRRLYRRLAVYPALHVGRAYVDGSLTIEEGELSDFLDLVLINEQLGSKGRAGEIKRRLHEMTRFSAVINLPGRARRNVRHHYDHPVDFYRCFLDEDMQYSCAYFADENVPLEEAQEARRHIAAKLDLRAASRARHRLRLWRHVAVSRTQLRRACYGHHTEHRAAQDRARARRQAGALAPRRFRLEDYRRTRGVFDRIVSVGMFEHVGRPHYRRFFSRLNALLTEDGVALLHTIGRQPAVSDQRLIRQNIFPGAYLPSLSQLAPEAGEAGPLAHRLREPAPALRHDPEGVEPALPAKPREGARA
jgi:cyclopropane-fatty-acyl-phospholipid synthase